MKKVMIGNHAVSWGVLRSRVEVISAYPITPQTQIVEALVAHLHPAGAIVVVEGEHLCMSMRGVRKPGAKTVTSAVRGQLRNPATRAEAMDLIVAQGR